MAGNFDRIDTSLLYGPFFAKLQTLVAKCEARGARYVATSGLRTFKQQTALFEQGRTKPGNIVTNARAGESPHNYGVAVDFVRDIDRAKKGVQPTWKPIYYEILATEAEKLGLEAGAHWKRFKDVPHIQLPLSAHGLTWKKLKAAHAKGKVLQLLDAVAW